jgi:hypothetical protein
MPVLDRAQLISALTYLVIALFVLTGMVSLRHRATVRRSAVLLYLAVLAGVVIWVALWAAGLAG